MATAILEANRSNGLPVFQQSGISDLFEVLFGGKSKHHHQVHIKNPDAVRRKLTRIMALGKDKLQVISDFDWTMSKFLINGQVNPSCHGIFEEAPDVTPEIQNQIRIIRQTYEPIEWDPTIPVSMKIPLMVEWLDLTHKAIASSGMHKDALKASVNQWNIALRDCLDDFMTQLHEENIPMMVFSAGLGNVIELVLERFHLDFDNVRVVSNFLDVNDEGLLVESHEPIIHTFNKMISSVSNSEYIKKALSKRSSVILLGDSPGDKNMADGICGDSVDSPVNILKIGFLNENVETLLDTYMDIYDIVLTEDPTFKIPLEVLNCIIQSESLNVKKRQRHRTCSTEAQPLLTQSLPLPNAH